MAKIPYYTFKESTLVQPLGVLVKTKIVRLPETINQKAAVGEKIDFYQVL